MFSALLSIISLLSSWGLLLVANALLGTLLTLRAEHDGFTTTTVGIISAAYFLGLFIGARYGNRLVNQVGHIRAFAVYASITSIAALIHAIVIEPVTWTIVRASAGFCMAALSMIIESWLNSRATNQTRGRDLSLFMITNFLAAGVGQLLIPLADISTFVLFSVASICYSLALVPVLLTSLAAPQVKPASEINIFETFKISQVGIWGSAVAGVVTASLFGLGPLYTQQVGNSTTITAIFMSLSILGGVILQWPIGMLSDRMDRRKVLVAVSFISAVTAIAILFAAQIHLWVFYGSALLYGAFCFTIYPISSAHMNDATPPEDMILTAAGLLASYGIGAVVGPLVASVLMEWFGNDMLLYFIAGVLTAFGLFIVYRMKVSEAPERKKRRFYISRRAIEIIMKRDTISAEKPDESPESEQEK